MFVHYTFSQYYISNIFYCILVPLIGGIQLLEQIIKDQRGIFSNIFNTSDVTTIPQVWTLCNSFFKSVYTVFYSLICPTVDSEVEGYYEEGLPVPDDVALMWTDDECAPFLPMKILSFH